MLVTHLQIVYVRQTKRTRANNTVNNKKLTVIEDYASILCPILIPANFCKF